MSELISAIYTIAGVLFILVMFWGLHLTLFAVRILRKLNEIIVEQSRMETRLTSIIYKETDV